MDLTACKKGNSKVGSIPTSKLAKLVRKSNGNKYTVFCFQGLQKLSRHVRQSKIWYSDRRATNLMLDHLELSDSDGPSRSKKRKRDEFRRLFKSASSPEDLRDLVKRDPTLQEHFVGIDLDTFDFGPTYDSFKLFQDIYLRGAKGETNTSRTVKDTSSLIIAEVEISSPVITTHHIGKSENTQSSAMSLGSDSTPQDSIAIGTELPSDPFSASWSEEFANYLEIPFKPINGMNPSDLGFLSPPNPTTSYGSGFTFNGPFNPMRSAMPSLSGGYQSHSTSSTYGGDFANERQFDPMNNIVPSNLQHYSMHPSRVVYGSRLMNGTRFGPSYDMGPFAYQNNNLQNTTSNYGSAPPTEYHFNDVPSVMPPNHQHYSSPQPLGSYEQQGLAYRPKSDIVGIAIGSIPNHFTQQKSLQHPDSGLTYEHSPGLHPAHGNSVVQTDRIRGDDAPDISRPKSRAFAASISPSNAAKCEPGKEVHSTEKGGTFVLRQKSKSGPFSPPMVVP
jgi:hypothetical protein